MAKRIYTKRTISPEIARENALSIARVHVVNARKYLAHRESCLASYIKQEDEQGIAAGQNNVQLAREDLYRAEVALAKQEAE